MKPEFSLPFLKQSFSCTRPEPDESDPLPCFCQIHLNILFVCSSLQNDTFPQVFSQNPARLRFSIYATCPAHLIVLHLKYGQFILEYCLSVLTKNMDCSTVSCLLLIYSVDW
jgi:hypothetical protein